MERIDYGDDDDGFVPTKINGFEKPIDVYETNNKIVELAKSVEGQPAHVWHKKVAAMMEEMGFPGPISTRLADRFIVDVGKLSSTLAKKTGVGIALQDSTDSIPTDGPIENLPDTNET